MLEFQVTNVATADDDEVAACIAAVRCVLEESAVVNEAQTARVNLWRRAAAMEGTGRAARISDIAKVPKAKNLWRAINASTLASLILSVSLTIGVSTEVRAADATPPVVLRPPIAVDEAASVMPPVAPDRNAAGGAGDASVAPTNGVPNIPTAAGSLPTVPSPVVSQRLVRVLLCSGRTLAGFSFPDGAQLKDMTTGETLAHLPPQSRWQVSLRAADTYPQLSFNGTIGNVRHSRVLLATRSEYRNVAFASPAVPMPPEMVPIPTTLNPSFWLPAASRSATNSSRAYVLVPPQPDGLIGTSDRLYRGAMMIKPTGSGAFDIINYVDLEDYLQSVVPSEMPSGWPLEALKAQAIAARSYAVANFGKHDKEGYDLKANTEDQVYAGVNSESSSTNKAVAETRETILRCQGAVVTAYFHSASGGWTEQSEYVWSKPLPYLRAIADYDDQSPHFKWTRSCSVAQAEQSLANKQIGKLLNLMPVCRGASPRVCWLMVVGSEKTALISGEEARKLFGLPSSVFNVSGNGQSYVFAGRGFGHGLGMSQWGAKRLAEVGFNANDILNYYYKDVRIERL